MSVFRTSLVGPLAPTAVRKVRIRWGESSLRKASDIASLAVAGSSLVRHPYVPGLVQLRPGAAAGRSLPGLPGLSTAF
jgi:hypothetical protein